MSATQLFAAAPARACDALLSQVDGRLRDLLATEMSRWSAVDRRGGVAARLCSVTHTPR
jgi:hypothetical protein